MRQFSALAPGTGRFRNSCYFGNLLLSGEQIPPCSGPVERGLCAAVRDGRKPANGLWPSGTPVQRHCGKHTDGQTAFREPASIHFSPNGYGRAVRAGYSGQSPILVRAPTHRQVRSFHSFLSGCRKNDPSISSFPTSRALILRAGSFKAAAPVPCAAEKGFHFTNGNQDTRFRDSLNRRRDPPVRDRLRCGFS